MRSHIILLQVNLMNGQFTYALICMITAFVVTLLTIPPVIRLLKRLHWLDLPNARKEHVQPIPTMGGLAIFAGMMAALVLWFPFANNVIQLCFFFSLLGLLALGVLDDRLDLSARYKFAVQTGLASLIALSGVRIESFGGFLGIYDLSLSAQYTITILAIVGITNAFNLIDGIDGLAGGLGFMSLVTLGLFMTLTGDSGTALICFALAGGLLAFLYFNLNPARIFMGDTGSLILGFVIAVTGIRFMQFNDHSASPMVPHAPTFVLGLTLIPVFDTLRVFATRIWKGRSPFSADKTHIHHLLTNQGFTHGFAARVICVAHALVLLESYWLRNTPMEMAVAMLFSLMMLITLILKNLGRFRVFENYRANKTVAG